MSHLRTNWKYPIAVSQNDDPNATLQDFLSLKNVSPVEIDQIADLLEKLVEYHNIHLDKLNLDHLTQEPIETLSEK